jgi:hypothetical protein
MRSTAEPASPEGRTPLVPTRERRRQQRQGRRRQHRSGGRLEIIADFGDQHLAFPEPGTEAA